jgi:ATP-dependent DNA ligase
MGGGTYQTAFYGSVNRLTTMTDPHFIESMQCLAVKRSPEGEAWEYELKLDGYRALAVKRDGLVTLFSRNRKRFKGRFPGIAAAFAKLPDNTIIDGEIVAMDESGRPSFSRLQNFSANAGSITFYAFDMPMWNGKDLRTQPLDKRRELLRTKAMSKMPAIRFSESFTADAEKMISAVRSQGLEGIVAKRPGTNPGPFRVDRFQLSLRQAHVTVTPYAVLHPPPLQDSEAPAQCRYSSRSLDR